MNTTAINGEIACLDLVISIPDCDCPLMVGEVNAVDKVGSDEHNGGLFDDVFVNFQFEDYPLERIQEIEKELSDRHGESIKFSDLDNVLVKPNQLICISNLPQEQREKLITDKAYAKEYCDSITTQKVNDRKQQLIERINKNFVDYHESLMGFGQRELIDMAGKISAMSDARSYMTVYHEFSEDELDYFLEFQNPLEVVADAWHDRNTDVGDVSYTVDAIMEYRDRQNYYPLINEVAAPADPTLRRYMDIDLELYLGKIAEKVIIHHPDDWNIDMRTLRRAAASDNPDDKRLMWHVSKWGTHLNTERDTFIKDTGAFNTWVSYRPKDEDMFGYVVEVTGYEGGIIKGNVFEVGDYYVHSLYVRETALIFDAVSLTYSDSWGVNAGKTITVPKFEYNDDRHRLMSESGNVIALTYHPWEATRTMSDLLRTERSKRMSLPIGSTGELLRKMADKLAEVRKPPEQARPPAAKKLSITAQLAVADAEAKAHNAQRAQVTTQTNKKTKKEID